MAEKLSQKEFSSRGGRARMESMTPEERSEFSRKAGIASGKARRRKAREKKKQIEALVQELLAQKKKPP